MTEPTSEYDSPWKDALELFFEPFLLLCFPEVHAQIDWSRQPEFLDKELQQVVRDAELGPRVVDKLVKVWCKDGSEAWVLIHVEVQMQVTGGFPKRMYVYNYRLFDKFDRPVGSLAVLGDASESWRPSQFGYEVFGCAPGIRFPVLKLLDFEQRWEELEASMNPFAPVIMAHLRTLSTHGEPESRLRWKVRLIRHLTERGHDRETTLELFRLIDWMVRLPPELDVQFDAEVMEMEEKTTMPYVTRYEQRGEQRGEQRATLRELRESVLSNLHDRFDFVPAVLMDRIQTLDAPEQLRRLRSQAVRAATVEAFTAALEDDAVRSRGV